MSGRLHVYRGHVNVSGVVVRTVHKLCITVTPSQVMRMNTTAAARPHTHVAAVALLTKIDICYTVTPVVMVAIKWGVGRGGGGWADDDKMSSSPVTRVTLCCTHLQFNLILFSNRPRSVCKTYK